MKSSSELWPVDVLEFLMGLHVSISPVGYKTRELMRG
jgi:hypothetical protein